MQKICVICGKTFIPRFNMNKRQICCSRECSKMHYRNQARLYQQSEKAKIKHREWYRNYTKNKTLCRICGKPTVAVNTPNKPLYHTECVVNEAIELIKNRCKLTKVQRNRLYLLGYTIADIKEIIREREKV